MESKNRYVGVHPYVLSCVRKFSRMIIQKSPCFLPDDYEDIEQELVMYFLSEEAKIDASRSDWKLHVFMILKKRAFKIQLREEAQKRGGRERPLSFYLTPDGGGHESPELHDVLPSEQGLWGDNFFRWNHLNTEVRADIQKFIDGLPPRYQQLCEWLKEKSITEISQDTHTARTTLSSAVGVLRKKMREAGLEIYLNPASSVSEAFVKPSPERPKTTKETMDEKKTAPGISEDLQHAPGSVEGDQPIQATEAVGGGDRGEPQGGPGASVAGGDYPVADGQVTEGSTPKVVTLRVDYRQQTAELKERLLHDLPAVLKHLLPNGVTRHGKFYVGDVQGNRGESMVVELVGPKAGLWHDFATGDGGDILSLWAAVRGMNAQADFPRLMQDIREWLGVMPPARDIKPEVKTRPSQKVRNDKGPVTGLWDYLSATGELLCTVYRFDPPGQRKVYQPWDVLLGKMAWPEAPRPLFNLPGLLVAMRVVLAEGEKAAHALNGAGICATTAMNGANAVIEKTDWAPLAGKHVLIWPDNDEEGRNYAVRAASAIAKAGAAKVEILQPPAGRPDKWDGADAVAEGLDIERFLATAERMVIK